jgi:hypothetical protein
MIVTMSMGLHYFSELRPTMDLFFIPQVIMSMENHRGMISTGENLWFDNQRDLSGETTSSHLVAKQRNWAKEIINLALRRVFVHTWKGFLTCRKILRHGANGFTSTPKEGVLRIIWPLKISCHWPGLKPQTVGLMARTLAFTPPRMTVLIFKGMRIFRQSVVFPETGTKKRNTVNLLRSCDKSSS